MTTKKVNTYSVIVITNSCDTKPNINDEKHETAHKGPNTHGIGLKNTAKALEKYEGSFDWEYDAQNKEFTMTAMLIEKAVI